MPESIRTSIRLTKILWDFIDNSIGVLGYNRSAVIETIIFSYFKEEKNRNEIKTMQKDRTEIINNRLKIKAKIPEDIQDRLINLLEIADNIPIDTFIEHLNIDSRIFHENLYSWAKKFNFKFENDKIIKTN